MLASVMGHARRNLVAYVALLFALGGTSYAAATKLVSSNSVGSRQVINHPLLKKDFKPGQLPRGPQRPKETWVTLVIPDLLASRQWAEPRAQRVRCA
jgi:hypothetical protein